MSNDELARKVFELGDEIFSVAQGLIEEEEPGLDETRKLVFLDSKLTSMLLMVKSAVGLILSRKPTLCREIVQSNLSKGEELEKILEMLSTQIEILNLYRAGKVETSTIDEAEA